MRVVTQTDDGQQLVKVAGTDRGSASHVGLPHLRVVTSHPGKQVVVYSIVRELLLRDVLSAHLASVYYDQSKLRYSLWRHLPATVGDRIDRQLRKRHSADIPGRLVVDAPYVEMVIAALGRIPVLSDLLSGKQLYRCTSYFHDWWMARWVLRHPGIDVVMAFQGAALETLKAARTINAKAVLVATHPLDHEQIVTTEYAKLGQRMKLAMTTTRVLREAAAADYILTASTYTTESLIKRGLPSDRIKEIPYGIEFAAGRPPRERSIVKEPVRFLFVGKLSVHKGIHILRQAFDSLPSNDIRLTVIGRPVGPVERRLMDSWRDPRVRFVPEVADVQDEYFNADVFVLPSLAEGFGMVTLEAMASGLPVIVTDRCGTVVRDGIDGYIVASGSYEALSDGIMRLASCPNERLRLGENAVRRAREFTWQRFGSDLDRWLREIVSLERRDAATPNATR